jgi:hypothetical protein
LKSSRLIVKLPVAVLVPPAWVSVTGTTTGCVVPLIASCRPPRTAAAERLDALDWKLACGNLAVEPVGLGHLGLGLGGADRWRCRSRS